LFLAAAPEHGEIGEKIVAQRILIDQQQQLIEHLSRELLLMMRGDQGDDADRDDSETPEFLNRDVSVDVDGGEFDHDLHDPRHSQSHHPHLRKEDPSPSMLLSSSLSPYTTPAHHEGFDYSTLIDSYSDPRAEALRTHRGDPQYEGALSNIRDELGNVALAEHQQLQ